MLSLSISARNLDRDELQTLVDRIATNPESWRHGLAFSDHERHYLSLYSDDYVGVWLLCWTRANDTGWHDHDVSSGAVRVVQGSIRESTPRLLGEPVSRVITAGHSFCFGPDHIHRLAGETEQSASIHAYSPPLRRLGQYTIGADGVMRRVSISYAEELRPAEAGVAA